MVVQMEPWKILNLWVSCLSLGFSSVTLAIVKTINYMVAELKTDYQARNKEQLCQNNSCEDAEEFMNLRGRMSTSSEEGMR